MRYAFEPAAHEGERRRRGMTCGLGSGSRRKRNKRTSNSSRTTDWRSSDNEVGARAIDSLESTDPHHRLFLIFNGPVKSESPCERIAADVHVERKEAKKGILEKSADRNPPRQNRQLQQ